MGIHHSSRAMPAWPPAAGGPPSATRRAPSPAELFDPSGAKRSTAKRPGPTAPAASDPLGLGLGLGAGLGVAPLGSGSGAAGIGSARETPRRALPPKPAPGGARGAGARS